MAKQLYFEDIEVGMEITPLPKVATTQILVKWAGASGDFNPLHYDNTFAAAQAVGKPIVHGQLKRAWLVHLMTNWIGEQGDLKKLSCQFRGVDYPLPMKSATEWQEGGTWWCKGYVTNKYVNDSGHYVECNVWVENQNGEKTTIGSATVSLPSRV